MGQGIAALSPSPWRSAVRSWQPDTRELVKHPMGKRAFLCCEERARQACGAAGPALDWAGCWATKLVDMRCGDFSGNFKEFLELELLWGLHW